jgi:hypothetical protein
MFTTWYFFVHSISCTSALALFPVPCTFCIYKCPCITVHFCCIGIWYIGRYLVDIKYVPVAAYVDNYQCCTVMLCSILDPKPVGSGILLPGGIRLFDIKIWILFQFFNLSTGTILLCLHTYSLGKKKKYLESFAAVISYLLFVVLGQDPDPK